MNLRRDSLQFKIILPLAVLLVFFAPKNHILANSSEKRVIINEIAWMGTPTSSSDEWIEFFNPTSEEINLENWRILAIDGSIDVILSGIVDANGYFLLERTDDDSVANISADFVYSGTLGNTGEILELYDDSNNLIDSIRNFWNNSP